MHGLASTRCRTVCAIALLFCAGTVRLWPQDNDSWGQARIEKDSEGRPVAVLENSRIRARWSYGTGESSRFALRELTLKRSDGEQPIDCGAGLDFPGDGLDIGDARVAADLPDRKSVLLCWRRNASERYPTIRKLYSISPDSAVLRVQYLNGGTSERDLLAPSHDLLDLAPPPAGDASREPLRTESLEGLPKYENNYLLGYRISSAKGVLGRCIPADVVERISRLPSGEVEFTVRPRAMYTGYLIAGATGGEVAETARTVAAGLLRQTRPSEGQIVTHGEFKADPRWQRIENSQLAIAFAPDVIQGRGPKAGIAKFQLKSSDHNYAVVMDAFGAGYALYSIGPNRFEVSHAGDDFLEATLTRTDHVDVVESYRLFRQAPVLEIEYRRLKLTWWEDFYKVPGDAIVYSIYGLDREIDTEMHAALRKRAEETAGHNFGDAFLRAAGANPEKCAYAGHFIFGAYDRITGHGLGFVMPTRVGLHSGFKLWSMGNYESFPFRWLGKTAADGAEREKLLPLRRWIFAFEGGREGLFTEGRRIAEAAAAPNLETRAARLAGLRRAPEHTSKSPAALLASGVRSR